MHRGDKHPNKCRCCHGCTIDNKCDTYSKWTDIVWAGIVERSQARLSRKCHAIDKPATKLKPTATLRKENSHKDKRARLELCSISSGSFLGFSPMPSPEIIQNRESMFEEIFYLLREQRSVPNVINNTTNQPCASGGPVSTWMFDGTARTNDNVPAVGLPTRVSEHLSSSLDQWTYAEGPAPGEKPETYLGAKPPDDSPEPNPAIDLDEAELMNCLTNQNPLQADSVAGARFLHLTNLCPNSRPNRVNRTSWSLPLSGDDS